MDSASMAASPSAPKFGPTADGEITMSSDSKWGKSRESRDKSRVAGNQQSKGGRGSQTSRRRRKDKGRAEWSRDAVDKRARNDEKQRESKRRKMNGEEETLPVYASQFTQEEIAAQERRPKRKVAVMIGYSGSGYKGMQLNHNEKTIEGDLFGAFVAAGAISKANADDPKKSSLVRCARTDKGVHAAGNLISLKLVIEDPDIVRKINEQLSPQIRVWAIERTNGSFSSYQFCDSRIYEYLIPTHCFLPPHPQSFLGQQMIEIAKEADDLAGYEDRQKEVLDYWAKTEGLFINPIIEEIDPAIRDEVLQIFCTHDTSLTQNTSQSVDNLPSALNTTSSLPDERAMLSTGVSPEGLKIKQTPKSKIRPPEKPCAGQFVPGTIRQPRELTPVEYALRLLKIAHVDAKKAYRIGPDRLARVRSALSRFVGSHRYHNYTIEKSYKDPSATRTIRSFVVDEKPIVIKDSEWLSLKVHGQSFMMHQIRKMVSMVTLLVRCGTHEGRMQDTFMSERLSIPKAPSLGLLLERPLFDEYNKKLEEFGHKRIDYGRYEHEIENFKQREIYERIFREEERDNTFHVFFSGLDGTRSTQLLFLSSMGTDAIKRDITEGTSKLTGVANNIKEISSDDEDERVEIVDS